MARKPENLILSSNQALLAMSNSHHFPLQERVPLRNSVQRLLDLLLLFLLLSLLFFRVASIHAHGFLWLAAFACESWFTFVWFLGVNACWNPVTYKTYPEHLSKRFDDLPPVDMFVTTADPNLEPPIVTVNTVLSLLAVEYPAHRLACYVSDDGCSPVTYYALCEASKFAKLWVPFCRKYNVRVRAPFVYFSSTNSEPIESSDFMQDWKYMKNEYEELSRRIEGGGKSYVPYHMNDEFADFSSIEKANHPSIVKVIWENKEEDGNGIPHLIYVAREKKPKHPHHFKAGAMNVLTRVSAVMTNAPFMLNVDCDMFANNPEVMLHGMCLLLGFDDEVFSGFVQAPQQFYGALKDDPFGNQLVVLQKKLGFGIGGIQGPFYGGTGCFHRRKVIYGSSPETRKTSKQKERNVGSSHKELLRVYGNSKELVQSADEIISQKIRRFPASSNLSTKISAAKEVAACTYELNTCWGQEIGWVYGSMTEDILTGIRIQSMGWRSVQLTTEPPAFLGSAPTGGPASLTQYKRWSTGLLEVLFLPNGPILATLTKRLAFRQCLAYLVVNIWALRSVVEFCYSLLPAYCLLTNVTFLPKASSPEFLLLVAIFATYNMHTLLQYLECGLSVRAWWNNLRMQRISSATAWLFGFLSVVLKLLGLSETIFEVTRKDQSTSSDDNVDVNSGRFTFDSSPFFVPGTALVLVHLAAVATAAVRVLAGSAQGWGPGEVVCSGWVILSFWPFVKGCFAKGSYGIPWSVVWKATVLGSVFLQVCMLGPIS